MPAGSSLEGCLGKRVLCLLCFCLLCSLILRGLVEEGASPCAGICSFIPKTLSGCAQDPLAARCVSKAWG